MFCLHFHSTISWENNVWFQETFLASNSVNSVKGRLKFQKDSLKSNFVKKFKDKAKWNRQLRGVKLGLFVYLESLFQNLDWSGFCKFHPIHEYSNAHFANEERKFPSVERHIHVVWNGHTNNVSSSQKVWIHVAWVR